MPFLPRPLVRGRGPRALVVLSVRRGGKSSDRRVGGVSPVKQVASAAGRGVRSAIANERS
eukprot:scaffold270947_cov30-Tisochrysis_lutea.AAC.1